MDLGSTQVDSLPPVQKDACERASGVKPAIPKKPIMLNPTETNTKRTSHVKDLVRKLQERESPNRIAKNQNIPKMGAKLSKPFSLFAKDEAKPDTSNKTLEDLQAIDEDIEKLRKQIEERDKIISALREAAEAKDKKLENFMMEYNKLQSSGKLQDLDPSSEPIRANSSSPTSPPLCDGELCWTDSFVNKNYHEPVYAQLLNDHTALQKTYNELKMKLEAKGKEFERLEAETKAAESGAKAENQDNAINLIMAEQIRMLKEREAQLMAEAEELREQNDLMEFRILELEECRKEFLDKEVINEEKHRPEKLMWSDRDVEDISDSGVMSLPTSDDLNSDSELSEGIRNYSPLGPVTNLSLLPPENFYSDPGVSEVKSKKSLKSFECLQESGIFEESEPSSNVAELPSKHSRGCQTETILDKTLLDLIDSSFDLLLTKNRSYLEQKYSDDLSTEISKLSVIQKRIQQKAKTPPHQGPHSLFTCPHSHSVLFYEERLGQLEDKLKIYESSGDTKDILLSKRLQKEIELACRVKELTEKVANLEVNNRKLEEEKCEFEEAENDTRFQCQRLEIRLQELIEKNADLEVELDRQKVKMSEERRKDKKKESLENLISRYEQKTFELEEKEEEARQRLSMIEAAMPVIIAWNVFRVSQNPEFKNLLVGPSSKDNKSSVKAKKNQFEEGVVFKKLEELLNDQKKLRKEYEKVEESAADREKILRDKIEELESKAAKDREMLEEMTNALKVLKSEEKCQMVNPNVLRAPEEIDLFEELKIMVANETHLRAEINRLEKQEQAYIESLEKCDEIWDGMETEYKRRLKVAEENAQELQNRISQLELTQQELKKALATRPQEESKSDVQFKLEELLEENENLKAELTRKMDKNFEERKKVLAGENDLLKDEIKKLKAEFLSEEKKFDSIMRELEAAKEEAAQQKELTDLLREEKETLSRKAHLKETTFRNQVLKLSEDLIKSYKEVSNLEVTVAELREEVETLEAKIAKLVETIQDSADKQEEEPFAGRRENMQLALPVEEGARQIVPADFEGPSDEVVENRIVADKQIMYKSVQDTPAVQVLLPCYFDYKYLVCFSPVSLRQEAKFLQPHSLSSSQMQMKYARSPSTMVLWVWSNQNADKPNREDEIFQLSLKNSELLQLLEKMEEESKLKDKELEELQKLAHEIRKEQEAIEHMCHTKFSKARPPPSPFVKFEEIPLQEDVNKKSMEAMLASPHEEFAVQICDYDEGREDFMKTESVDFLQIANPIVVKASEEISSSVNNSNMALDTITNSRRTRQSFFNEINQKGDSRDYEDMMDQLSHQSSMMLKKKDSNSRYDNLFFETGSTISSTESSRFKERKSRPSTPNHLGRSSSASSSIPPNLAYSKHFGPKSQGLDTVFSYVAPIRTMREIGNDRLFLEWDITHKPDIVNGFEILVNGTPNQRVRSSTRNMALLHQLNLSEKILIQVFATSERGRSIRCSHVTYPDEHFIYRTESE